MEQTTAATPALAQPETKDTPGGAYFLVNRWVFPSGRISELNRGVGDGPLGYTMCK